LPSPSQLSYARPDATPESVSRALWFGYHLGIFSTTVGLLVVGAVYLTGFRELGGLLLLVGAGGTVGLPLTLAGAFRRRPGGWLPIFLVAFVCNGLACTPAVATVCLMIYWLY
jgi:hypothetical protein